MRSGLSIFFPFVQYTRFITHNFFCSSQIPMSGRSLPSQYAVPTTPFISVSDSDLQEFLNAATARTSCAGAGPQIFLQSKPAPMDLASMSTLVHQPIEIDVSGVQYGVRNFGGVPTLPFATPHMGFGNFASSPPLQIDVSAFGGAQSISPVPECKTIASEADHLPVESRGLLGALGGRQAVKPKVYFAACCR